MGEKTQAAHPVLAGQAYFDSHPHLETPPAAFFRRLAPDGSLTYTQFERALHRLNHPVVQNPELVREIFTALDTNADGVVDKADFASYLQRAERQIVAGFNMIDADHDGLIDKADFVRYLRLQLNLDPSQQMLNQFFLCVDTHSDGIITYDEWRDFLVLMPRHYGSRIATAYRFLISDMDVVLLDGDVTLVLDVLSGFGYFAAGGLSGVVLRTATAPFDRIKVFLIARADLLSTLLHSKRSIQSHMHKEPAVELAKIRLPLVKAATTIWRQGGLRGFYVGNGLNSAKVFPELAIKFGLFEAAKRFMAQLEGVQDTLQLSKASTFLSGGIGGVISQFCVYPIDTLKYRVQCSNLETSTKGGLLLVQTAREMYAEGGLRLFYRGVFTGVSGIFPYAALDLGTFLSLKQWYLKREALRTNQPLEDVSLPNYLTLSMGALSGTFGATVVYPINLVRTRLQAQGTYAHPFTYTGFVDAFQQTVKREGYPGLFKGLVPNLAKVAPAVSISYLCYENLKVLFNVEER